MTEYSNFMMTLNGVKTFTNLHLADIAAIGFLTLWELLKCALGHRRFIYNVVLGIY